MNKWSNQMSAYMIMSCQDYYRNMSVFHGTSCTMLFLEFLQFLFCIVRRPTSIRDKVSLDKVSL